jgi:uncharacterized protein
MRKPLKWLIRLYQLTLSPFVGQHCRFHPSCSHYAMEAIDSHGSLRGSVLTIKRLCRCHPWHPGGIDLVPDPPEKTHRQARTDASSHHC